MGWLDIILYVGGGRPVIWSAVSQMSIQAVKDARKAQVSTGASSLLWDSIIEESLSCSRFGGNPVG